MSVAKCLGADDLVAMNMRELQAVDNCIDTSALQPCREPLDVRTSLGDDRRQHRACGRGRSGCGCCTMAVNYLAMSLKN